jgi:proteasome beta subunit
MEISSEMKNSMMKTGTTLVGMVCKDGIVMASDRQTTGGTVVLSKDTQKTVLINDYLVYSGCGLSAAIKRTAKIVAAELRLKELRAKSRPTVKEAANLLAQIIYYNIRQPSMVPDEMGALISGFNEDGSTELYTIDPAGNIQKVKDFDASIGSGMPYVLGLLERQYKPTLTIKEGIELAIESIKSSTQRDTGSGYGIDVFSITKDGIKKVVDQDIVSEYRETKR